MDANFTTKLAHKINERACGNQFSGAILIRRGRQDIFRRAYGTWNIRNKPKTRFRIASSGEDVHELLMETK